MNKDKKSYFINPYQKQNEPNHQKYNIKATRPSPVCWEELKLVLDNETYQNKKVSIISNVKNSKQQSKSKTPNSNSNSQSNKNNKKFSSNKKETILYLPYPLSKAKVCCDMFGYFNGPIIKKDKINKANQKQQKIELKIEISFEFQVMHLTKIDLTLDENKLCHYSSASLELQQPNEEQSQLTNENQNLCYQMQWNPYYPNMIAHSNSFPKVQYVPIVQGYALYPQSQQYQQQIHKVQQLNQSSSIGAIYPNNQSKEEK